MRVHVNDAKYLPVELRKEDGPREFDVIREDAPAGRLLLAMPKGVGHRAAGEQRDGWWVPTDDCTVLE